MACVTSTHFLRWGEVSLHPAHIWCPWLVRNIYFKGELMSTYVIKFGILPTLGENRYLGITPAPSFPGNHQSVTTGQWTLTASFTLDKINHDPLSHTIQDPRKTIYHSAVQCSPNLAQTQFHPRNDLGLILYFLFSCKNVRVHLDMTELPWVFFQYTHTKINQQIKIAPKYVKKYVN